MTLPCSVFVLGGGYRNGKSVYTECLRVKLDLERVSSSFYFTGSKNSSHVPILCLKLTKKREARSDVL